MSSAFWLQVNKSGPIPVHEPELGHCWVWTGFCSPQGYGRFKFGGRLLSAHRFSYELEIGPIRDGLTIDHLCRNRGCVRPSHLEPVTRKVNTLRGETIVAAHAAKTHCPKGHPYDEVNTRLYEGRRYCKQCLKDRESQPDVVALKREYHKQWYAKNKNRRNEANRKTHCKYGHTLDIEITRKDGRYQKLCSICAKDKARRMVEARQANRRKGALS